MERKVFFKRLRGKRDYLTFLLSLVLILLLPITTFSIFFTRFFSESYTQKLFSLAEATCTRTQTYFEQTIHQCDRIAEMLQKESVFQQENPGAQPVFWMDIVSQLRQSRVLNEALVEIVYQRSDSNVLFTSSGSLYEPASGPDIIHRLERIPDQAGFFREAFLGSGPSTTKPVIAYTVPFANGEGALSFWLDADKLLPAPVDADPRFSLMLLDNGITIWKNGAVDEEALTNLVSSQGNFHLYSTPSGRYYLNQMGTDGSTAVIYFILPYSMVMSESDTMTRTFVSGVLIEAIICIALIIFLAQRSYRPVHQLYGSVLKFAPELLPPVATGEIDAANYALQRMSNRQYNLEQQRRQAVQQKLLHRLFTGSLRDESALDQAGIHLSGKHSAVILFSLRREYPDKTFSALSSELRLLLEEREIISYSTDYIENRSQFFLVELEKDGQAAELILPVAQALERKLGRIFYFSCGSTVENLGDIWQSYCEAMSAQGTQEDDQIIYNYNCAPPPHNFSNVYPQAELDGLYNAIISQNTERIHFLTDSLLKQIQLSRGQFFASCLGYATAATLLRGMETIQESAFFERPPFRGFEDIREYLTDLCGTIIQWIKENKPRAAASDGFEQILAYIRDNIDNPDLSVSLIGDAMEISPAALGKLFHDRTGATISDYMGTLRHEHIKMLLLSTDLPVSEIARRMGYSQTSSFIRRFKSVEGITPGEYRAQRKANG